jgi:CubicO group peptidase (beta-lactamase class C family)
VDVLEKYLDSISDSNLPGFSYLISREGKVVLRGGFGLADVDRSIPNHDDTIYRAGSITKQFTAVSILHLASQGSLSLNDKLIQYFPNLPNSSKISIRNLLSHTSGIWDQKRDEEFPFPIDQYVEPEEHLSFIAKKGVLFEPGQEWRYSSNGYFVLGLIIEKVSKQSLDEFMKKNIFLPIGMGKTGLYSNKGENASLATGYGMNKDRTSYKEIDVNMETYNGAAAMFTTVNDLFLWNEALHNGKVLSEAMYSEFVTPYEFNNDFKPFVKYGFGVGVEDVGGKVTIGHPGQMKGF